MVPWVNRPLSLYLIPDATLVRYPTSAPPCHAAQLRVSQGRTGGAMTNVLEELVFTNTGTRPCLLRGYPTISGETPDGSRRVLHPERGGTFFGQLVPANLPPGGHVFLDLATPGLCDQGRKPATPLRYRHLVFTLPQGGTVRAEQVSISEGCGYLSMSQFGLQERYSQPRPAPGTAGTLTARLRVPTTIRAGSTLHYTVALSNPTTTTVRLRPCPGYSQALVTRVLIRQSFALNCDSVHAIPAHGHVRYAMQLTIPPRATPGIAKIAWNLNTPNGPFAAVGGQITSH